MNDLDRFTAAELNQLHERIYHWGTALFDRCNATLSRMRAIPTWTPEYRTLQAEADALQAAGNEQHELLQDVYAEITRRREAVNA